MGTLTEVVTETGYLDTEHVFVSDVQLWLFPLQCLHQLSCQVAHPA